MTCPPFGPAFETGVRHKETGDAEIEVQRGADIAALREQEAGSATDAVLAVRRHRGRKRATGTRASMALPNGPNQRWSLDFVADAFSWGRRFRILCIVDDFTREALALVVDTSIGGCRMARELDALIARRGRPALIVSDNGTEMTSRAMLEWTNRTGVDWHYIAPGKPQQNGFVESFNGKLRRGMPAP